MTSFVLPPPPDVTLREVYLLLGQMKQETQATIKSEIGALGDKIDLQIKTQTETIEEIRKDTDKLHHTVYGNGQPGLTTEVLFAKRMLTFAAWPVGPAIGAMTVGLLGLLWGLLNGTLVLGP